MWYEDPRNSERDENKDDGKHKAEELDETVDPKKEEDPDQSYSYTDWASI